MVQTETMSKQLLQNVGKLSVSSIGQAKRQCQRSFSKSKQGDRNRSSSGHRSQSQNQCTCGKCGKRHPPHKCPAYGQNCRCSGAKGHYAKCCKSKNPRNPKGRFSHKDTWEVSPEGPDDVEFEEDAIQIMFSKDSFHNNKHGQSLNIMFDEIEQTKALGDYSPPLILKCQSVPFFGNIVTNKGIRPDPSKVQAIKDWPVPNCLKDLQSFLGAVNFLSKFIPKLSKLHLPLQGLCKKDVDFMWSGTHQEAFNTIKDAICEEALLSYYDKDKPIFIEVDAGWQGLGAVLLQGDISHADASICNQTDGNYLLLRDCLKPIGYASKSLSEAEKRYSNIECELLGVVWAINHFHHYTFANKIYLISDHRPLHPLFSGKSLVSCSPRTARLLLKIVDKDVTFFYQNGPSMYVSDALSRLPSHNTQTGNKQEVKGLNVLVSKVSPIMSNVTLDMFRKETVTDKALSLLNLYVMHGWPSNENDCAEPVQTYFTFKEEISSVDGLIFKGQRLIMPQSLDTKPFKCFIDHTWVCPRH